MCSSNKKPTRLDIFLANMDFDLRLFFFLLLTLCTYRAYFMWYMADYMSSAAGFADIVTALWMGLRISLKSAGALALPPFVFGTLLTLIMPRLMGHFATRFRLWWGVLISFVLAILFEARFPYYREFRSGFDMHVLMGVNDDWGTIFSMAVDEYGLLWRTAAAVALAALSYVILNKIIVRRQPILRAPDLRHAWQKALFGTVLTAFIGFFMLFVRFGGSFGFTDSINFLSAAVTKDDFLNECILDDIQAIYRVQDFTKKMKAGNIEGVDLARLDEYATSVTGRNAAPSAIKTSTDLAPYLEWEAQGARIPRPKRIFIIIGESWASWPMLEKYADLHLADGIKGIINEKNAYSTRSFIPNGEGTAIGISGIITGLSAVNVDAQYQPKSFTAPYVTALAPQLKELGYRVDFWYGGMPSWVSLDRFTVAQGFDDFYGYPDYNAPKQNAWGTRDGCLFDALGARLKDETMPTVHVVMTVSNHPPYNLDLAAEGFDASSVKSVLAKMEHIEDIDTLTTELGHYWYMDKVTSDFMRRTLDEYPDSLFILVGDHAARTDPSTVPTLFENQSIPFVLYGQGVTDKILPPNAVGGHSSITATLIELIAPQGFRYHSIAESMTRAPLAAFSHTTWVTENMIGNFGGDCGELIPGKENSGADYAVERAKVDTVLGKLRTLSWFMLEK